MAMVLIYVLGAYLAVCWLWGIYLAIRLYAGRRVGRVMRGQGLGPRVVRPIRSTPRTTPGSTLVVTSDSAGGHASETVRESRAA